MLGACREAFKNTFDRLNTASIADRVCIALMSTMLQWPPPVIVEVVPVKL